MSRRKQVSGAFLEAGWLLAPVVAVLFLNPFSRQVFDPAKMYLLRSLTLVMFVFWIVHECESFESTRAMLTNWYRSITGNVYALLLGLLVGSYLLSSLFSVHPRLSFWGSYERLEGVLTLLCYLILFLSLLRGMQTRAQVDRFTTVLIVVAFPVAVYGILQHFGVPTLQFTGPAGNVLERTISTIGNPIPLGAYLLLIVPLLIWRLVLQAEAWWRRRTLAPGLGALFYSVLLVLVLSCMIFTQSRGPLLALGVQFFFLTFMLAMEFDQRKWGWGILVGSVLLSGTLIALNASALPLDSLRQLPYLDRFAMLGEEFTAGTFFKRVLAWRKVLGAMGTAPHRALIGFGPESVSALFVHYWGTESPVLLFDRAHNLWMDHLFNTGLLGVIAYLLLTGWMLYSTVGWLGWVPDRPARRMLASLLLVGGLAGLMLPGILLEDWALIAAGVPLGTLGGLFFYLFLRFVRDNDRVPRDNLYAPLLLIALLAAMVGYFVEEITGIGGVPSRFHFWVFLALLILVGQRRILESAPAFDDAPHGPEIRKSGRSRGVEPPFSRVEWATFALMGLVVSTILGGLAFAFLPIFHPFAVQKPILALGILVWGMAGILLILETASGPVGWTRLGRSLLIYTLVTFGWVLPLGVYERFRVTTPDVLNESLLIFVLWLFVTATVMASVLYRQQRKPVANPGSRSLHTWVGALGVSLIVGFFWVPNLNAMRADVYAKIGETALASNRREVGIEYLLRAIELAPRQAEYYRLVGDAYLEPAKRISDPTIRDAWLEQARQYFEQGWTLMPADSQFPWRLGDLWKTWAFYAQDPQTRTERQSRALQYLIAAAERNPGYPLIRLDLAESYFLLGYYEDALENYQLVAGWGHPLYLARAYAGLGDVYLVLGNAPDAIAAYRQAMQLGKDWQQVLNARRRMVETYPDNVAVHVKLALLLAGLERQEEALQELERALNLATPEQRPSVEQILRMVNEKQATAQ